jgi:hypothetical protein
MRPAKKDKPINLTGLDPTEELDEAAIRRAVKADPERVKRREKEEAERRAKSRQRKEKG